MFGAIFETLFPITSLIDQCLLRVEDSILHVINSSRNRAAVARLPGFWDEGFDVHQLGMIRGLS